jgi:thiamine-phosphate pyrophosphorylase
VSAALGPVLILTDRTLLTGGADELPAVVRAAALAGADGIVLREKDLDPTERVRLGRRIGDALSGTRTRLVVASDLDLARRLGADAVHLAQGDPAVAEPDRDRLLVGRSCHDRDEVVAAADDEAVDYVMVSPVFTTTSKPGHGPALGPAAAAALATAAGPPVPAYGLGGVSADNADACVRAGLRGVAVMGAVMRSSDPGRQVEAIVDAVARRRERVR